MVETLTPYSLEIVVLRTVLLTLEKFGKTKLFIFKSVLLKIIHEFGSDGFKEIFETFPLCKPIPLNFTGLLIVFWVSKFTKIL